MSRLEEINRDYEQINNGTNRIGIDESYFFDVHVDWLIEQAERVQELETYLEDCQTVVKGLHDRRRTLRKQNKRYREAIEKAIHEVDEGYYTDWIINNLRKALEGEE